MRSSVFPSVSANLHTAVVICHHPVTAVSGHAERVSGASPACVCKALQIRQPQTWPDSKTSGMGSCASCCGGGKQDSYDEMPSNTASAAQASDPEARARAAAAAEQRQQKFDQSAGGRAARKAVAEVARDRQAGRSDDNQIAKDWVN